MITTKNAKLKNKSKNKSQNATMITNKKETKFSKKMQEKKSYNATMIQTKQCKIEKQNNKKNVTECNNDKKQNI
jgi:hypothetical protein